MLPDGWKETSVGTHIRILSGFPFPSDRFSGLRDHGAPLIRIRDLLSGNPETYFSGEYDDAYLVEKDDILIGMDGDFHIVKWSGPDALLNQRICKISTADARTLDTGFLYYFIQPHISHIHGQIGATTVKHLSTKHIKSIQGLLPPLPEQRRIAEILRSVDAIIETTKTIIEQTKTMKQGLLRSLLTRGIGGTEFKDSPLGEIPEGWAERNLGHVIDFINGYAFKPEDWSTSGTPIIRIQNLNGSNEFNYYEGTVPSKCHVQEGDLLFCWSGSRGTSFGARKWQGPLGFLNQHIFRCVVSNELDQEFAFYLLEGMTRKIESEAHGGGGLVHIKKSELVKFEIGLPPLNEQKQIVEVLASVDHQIALESSKLERLFVLKSGLMDDLLTGKVRVPEAMGLAA